MDHLPKIVVETTKPTKKNEEPVTKTWFVQGPIKFQIDNSDLMKTLGAGMFVNDGPMFNKLNDTLFIRWAETNGLPVVPFDREKLVSVMRGVVQNAWYEHVEGAAPENCVINQQKRIAKYLREYNVDVNDTKDKPKRPHAGHFTAGPQRVYRLKEKLNVKFGGQQLVIFEWFKKHKQGVRAEITRDLEAAGFKANQPVDRVIAYYLNDWKKKGFLEELGEQNPLPLDKGKNDAGNNLSAAK